MDCLQLYAGILQANSSGAWQCIKSCLPLTTAMACFFVLNVWQNWVYFLQIVLLCVSCFLLRITFFPDMCNVVLRISSQEGMSIEWLNKELLYTTLVPCNTLFSHHVRGSFSPLHSVLLLLDNFDDAMHETGKEWETFLRSLVRDSKNSKKLSDGRRPFDVVVACKDFKNAERVAERFASVAQVIIIEDHPRAGDTDDIIVCNASDNTCVRSYRERLGRFSQF